MSDTVGFTLTLLSAEGTPADEPNATVQFNRTDGGPPRVVQHVVFPPARTFQVPAFPAIKLLSTDLTFSRYRIQKSEFFTPTEVPPPQQTVIAMRDPSKWMPAFTSVSQLSSARFDDLLTVMQRSDQVDFKHGPAVTGRLDQAYDGLAGEQAMLAKMALLNLHAVMMDEQNPLTNAPWFNANAVQRIVRLDRERFVAEVDASFRTTIQTILNQIDQFKKQGFFTELSPGLHVENFPDRYAASDLITVKKRYDQGNVQFTIATGHTTTGNVTLLDCDMDEHGQFLLHAIDLFRHPFVGGTHPVDMHEYIVAHSAKSNNGPSSVDLGYALQPADLMAPALASTMMRAFPMAMAAPPARKPRSARKTRRVRKARRPAKPRTQRVSVRRRKRTR